MPLPFASGGPAVPLAVFSDLARHYVDHAELDLAAGEKLVEMLALGPKDFVLDLGCGPGKLTRSIRRRTRGKLVGLDASAAMIAQARWNGGLRRHHVRGRRCPGGDL